MRKIKLMVDYQCAPLWGTTLNDLGDISPEELLLSIELKNSLYEWAGRFDAILNMNDPASSGFNSEREELLFIDDGYKLAQCLCKELGKEYEIIYQP